MDTMFYIISAILIFLGIVLIACTKIFGGDKVLSFLKSDLTQAVIGIIGAIVMYFTPDSIDKCIVAVFSALGITPLVLRPLLEDKR